MARMPPIDSPPATMMSQCSLQPVVRRLDARVPLLPSRAPQLLGRAAVAGELAAVAPCGRRAPEPCATKRSSIGVPPRPWISSTPRRPPRNVHGCDPESARLAVHSCRCSCTSTFEFFVMLSHRLMHTLCVRATSARLVAPAKSATPCHAEEWQSFVLDGSAEAETATACWFRCPRRGVAEDACAHTFILCCTRCRTRSSSFEAQVHLMLGDVQARRQRDDVLVVAADIEHEAVLLAVDLEIGLQRLVHHAVDDAPWTA